MLLKFVSYGIAYTCAFVSGIFISYALNALFVFRSGFTTHSFIRFPMVYLVQYFTGLVLVSTLIAKFKISARIAPVIAIMITVPLTFILLKTVFFKKHEVGSGHQ
jgi:putative flippase GtrA